MVFLDTTAVMSLFDGRDTHHNESKTTFEKVLETRTKMALTDYILDECITTILARVDHRTAMRAGEFILNSRTIDLIWLDNAQKLAAWDYFKKHDDQGFSFTDCTSFVLMKEMKISHYISFDDHFKQAGFVKFS
jgi:predicted nucleic acid-binding protein